MNFDNAEAMLRLKSKKRVRRSYLRTLDKLQTATARGGRGQSL